ncbi:hypothetical protein FVR03_00350 [Pontibacter qinzhouensis]|uniref:NfeD-like C-terminal domain-containing protein n=1 Tax=Pontibacter qinzhouensis TaxID=2603253 RepID=A0A5C8KFC5_9BACT|nr:hypothetical protein [Pontibacter qinzhouensis]TXK52859.1 hypothetical protein FVR03_00350 [Pontibacter qinzhouensis]
MVLDWVTVILLIGIGLVLIIVELIFIPGTTIVGVLGFALAAIGIWIGYVALGTTIGHIVLALSVLASGVAVFYSFRNDAWSRFALKGSISGKVNDDVLHTLHVGDTGKTVSALRPQGTAIFQEQHFEVQTQGEFIDSNAAIRIITLTANKIIVEEIS